jgi:hypothetical protein
VRARGRGGDRWRRAREAGDAAARRGRERALGYRLTRTNAGLALARVLVRGATSRSRVARRLRRGSASDPRRSRAPRTAVSLLDRAGPRAADTVDATPPRGPGRLRDVTLDGAPVSVSLEPVLPIAVVGNGGGFALALVPDPRHDESFANGVALR